MVSMPSAVTLPMPRWMLACTPRARKRPALPRRRRSACSATRSSSPVYRAPCVVADSILNAVYFRVGFAASFFLEESMSSILSWPAPGPIDLALHDVPHPAAETEWWYVNAHVELAD